MSSITLTLSGNSSSLTSYFHPEIELDDQNDYSCALLDFYTYNSIPNVTDANNKFYYTYRNITETIEIHVGSYEIAEICEIINKHLASEEVIFRMHGNKNISKTIIKCHPEICIDFSRENTIGPLLGFAKRKLEGDDYYMSENTVNITHITSIRIDCDLTTGSFHNGKSSHTLYEFSPSVAPGYKINVQPRNLIYLPIVRRRINSVNISVVDQNGESVDFRGERIICRVHIKKD